MQIHPGESIIQTISSVFLSVNCFWVASVSLELLLVNTSRYGQEAYSDCLVLQCQVGFTHFNLIQKLFLFSGRMKDTEFLVWTLILRSQHCICMWLFHSFHLKFSLYKIILSQGAQQPQLKGCLNPQESCISCLLFTTKSAHWSSLPLWGHFGAHLAPRTKHKWHQVGTDQRLGHRSHISVCRKRAGRGWFPWRWRKQTSPICRLFWSMENLCCAICKGSGKAATACNKTWPMQEHGRASPVFLSKVFTG